MADANGQVKILEIDEAFNQEDQHFDPDYYDHEVLNNADNAFVYSPYLSKSLYIKGLQCHKALWLHKYKPELQDEVSDSLQAVFDSGTNVGILAQQLFPGGVEVPYDGFTHEEQLARTEELIADGETTIYEATFSFDNILVKVDILHRSDNGWELYEVKASTKLKKVYLHDIAVQYYVLMGCRLNLSKTALVHINNKYVRQGNIEADKLFTTLDITSEVISRQTELKANIIAIRDMLQGDMPQIDIGPHCSDPYECSFGGHCWKHIPENSVFEFRGHGKPNAFELYRQGIVRMEDVPPDKLGWRQKLQLDGLLYHKNHFDTDAVREFLDSLWYPLCFMDFETTYMTPVPQFDFARPYQPIPFQFSLHVIQAPGSEIQHYEFFSDGSEDHRRGLIGRLLSYIPENACILAWNQKFEKRILRDLGQLFPEMDLTISTAISNIRDLMSPFASKAIYNWQFKGFYTLKTALPVIVPDLSYDALEVCNGEMASTAWLKMTQTQAAEEREMLRQQLLQYCHLDTLAMIKILEKITEMVNQGKETQALYNTVDA